MIINKRFAKKLYRGLKKGKTISNLNFSEKDFFNWCHTINVVNGMEDDEDMVNARWNLDKYRVPKAFEDLVIPRKISLEKGLAWNDLRANDYREYETQVKKYGMEEANLLKPIYFNEITDGILGSVKKSGEDKCNTLNVLSAAVAYSDYKLRFAEMPDGVEDDEVKVYSDDNGIIPIKAKSMDVFMEEKYYNNNLEDNLDTWLENALSNLKNN